MGLFEIVCVVIGILIGSFLWLHSAGNDTGVAFGAAGGAMLALGFAFVIRRVSYMLFGYKRTKDSRD